MVRAWGHDAFTLGVDDGKNCFVEYDKSEAVPIKECLGYHIMTAIKNKPVKYYLQILEENSINYVDSKEMADKMGSKEGLQVVDNKLRTSIRTSLQGHAYI